MERESRTGRGRKRVAKHTLTALRFLRHPNNEEMTDIIIVNKININNYKWKWMVKGANGVGGEEVGKAGRERKGRHTAPRSPNTPDT